MRAKGRPPTRSPGTSHPVATVQNVDLLQGLTETQRLAVSSPDTPLCVVAGAGSGKTRVLTRRVAWRAFEGTADPERTLVLTFTRKAASELDVRLQRLGVKPSVTSGTFHGIAYAQLRRHWSDTGQRAPAVLGYPERIITRLLTESLGSLPDPAAVSAVTGEISWARARVLGAGMYAAAAKRERRTAADPALVASVFSAYSDVKRRKGLVDLDDLVEQCADLLDENSSSADAQRWMFRHFFVDEFQDLNPAQWRLLRGWLGGRDDLFVVGDPLQAVYSWNGADPGLLSSIEELLPGTTVLRLDANHRCTQAIVEVARSILGELAPGAALRSAREEPRGRVAVRDFEDDVAEATALARWLRQRHASGQGWATLGVLARTNARLDPIEEALRLAGIPVRRGAAPNGNEQSVSLAALRSLPRGVPLRVALAELSSEVDDLDWLSSEVDALCEESPDANVGDLLSRLASRGRDDNIDEQAGETGENTDAVSLMSFHRAKGLEWGAVAVVGLEAGQVPIAYANTKQALAEERRLLYVALTRAEFDLWCSWAKRRTVGERTWTCEQSAYLSTLREASHHHPDVDPVPGSVHVAELKSRLAAAGGSRWTGNG